MTGRGRLPVVLVVLAAAIAGAVLAATRGLFDLTVYRFGGTAVLEGLPLYDGRDPVTGFPFTYPPFAALLMTPVALVPEFLAGALWTAASVAALVAVVVLARRGAPSDGAGHDGGAGRAAVGWPVIGIAVAAIALEPVWQTLSFGQVNLFLMLAVLVDLLRPERRWAGVLVGVAAGIKLTPLVFVVLLLLLGHRSAAGRAVLAFVGTVAVGFLLLPSTSWTYWTETLHDPTRVGGVAFAGNQSVYGELARLLDGPPSTLVWLAVAGPLSLLVLGVAAVVWRGGDRVLGTALGGLSMLLASPISWTHHWVWVVPLVIALARRSGPWARAGAAVAAVVFVAALPWWVPSRRQREYDWSVLEHVPGNAYLLVALGCALGAAWSLRSGRGGDRVGVRGPGACG